MATAGGALARWRAHLEEMLGVEDAAVVVDPFHTVDWEQLAVKGDVAAVKADVAAVKGDVADLKQEVAQLRGEVHAELRDVRAEIREVRRDMLRVTGAQFFALVAAVAAVIGFG